MREEWEIRGIGGVCTGLSVLDDSWGVTTFPQERKKVGVEMGLRHHLRMAQEDVDEFLKRLDRGPAYLLLGQRWLRNQDGEDFFLQQALGKFGATEAAAKSYFEIFGSQAS